MKLEIIKLQGIPYARPLGCLGSIGWSPKPWQLTIVTTGNPVRDFVQHNTKWKESDFSETMWG